MGTCMCLKFMRIGGYADMVQATLACEQCCSKSNLKDHIHASLKCLDFANWRGFNVNKLGLDTWCKSSQTALLANLNLKLLVRNVYTQALPIKILQSDVWTNAMPLPNYFILLLRLCSRRCSACFKELHGMFSVCVHKTLQQDVFAGLRLA